MSLGVIGRAATKEAGRNQQSKGRAKEKGRSSSEEESGRGLTEAATVSATFTRQ